MKKDIQTKAKLIELARAFGQEPDADLVAEVTAYMDFQNRIRQSVRASMDSDLALVLSTEALKKPEPEYPRPPSLDDLEQLLQEQPHELVQEPSQETIVTTDARPQADTPAQPSGPLAEHPEHREINVLQTFLTGLREGLEAALVVSILMSFMVRSGHRDRIPALWTGVTVAVVLSFGFGALLHYTSASMSFEAQEAFGGILSIVAVVFVTWMVFWMKRASRTLKGELHDKMSAAIEIGTIGVFTAALLAVGREGLETALFLYPTFQAQGAGAGPAIGALLGILTSVVIGVLLYRGVVSMNLAVFFKVTGAALIVIAAGVLAYGVHDLQEAGILPGIDNLAWDIDGWEITSWYGALLKGIFNLGPQMTVFEIVVYLGYLVPTMVLFLRPSGSARTVPATPAAAHAATVGEPAR